MKRLELKGQQYGRLTVGEFAFKVGHNVHWKCVCICGRPVTVSTTHLRSGHTASCGCIRSEVTAQRNVANQRHGMHKSPEFKVWAGIIQRCENPGHVKYSMYGGAGVSICAEWRTDFMAFFLHVGVRPSASHSIDRIDGLKGYEPGNVRWATVTEQNNNKRTNVFIEHDGVRQTVAQWSRQIGISHRKISYRMSAGWPIGRVLS